MGDDPSFGTASLEELLSRHGLTGRWCFIDNAGTYHGVDRERLEAVLRTSDLFVDMGTHGTLGDWCRTGSFGLRCVTAVLSGC